MPIVVLMVYEAFLERCFDYCNDEFHASTIEVVVEIVRWRSRTRPHKAEAEELDTPLLFA
jgi:hypothetical protein